LITKETTAIVV